MSFGPEILLLFFFIGLIAVAIDAIAGGGIMLLVLLVTGIFPAVGVATNKVGATVSYVSAALHFIKKGHINCCKVLIC